MTKRHKKKESEKKSQKRAASTPKVRPRAKSGAVKTMRGAALSTLKKGTVRKVAIKKETKQTKRERVAKRTLVQAPDWQAFYAVNGAVLHSLSDLARELETISEGEYLHHKDHFVSWVREVLGDDLCAEDLSDVATRSKAKKAVETHLKRYDVRTHSQS